MIEGIAAAGSAMAQRATRYEGSIAVTSKVHDQMKSEGRQAVQLIETAGRAGRGSQSPDGTGRLLNVRA